MLPASWWWPLAVVLLLVTACRLQGRLDDSESAAIKRLHNKPWVLFQEVATIIPSINPAYSREEVLHQLMKALWRGDFETLTGHARTRIYAHFFMGSPDANPIYSRRTLLAPGIGIDDPLPANWRELSVRQLNKVVNWKEVERHKPSDFDTQYIQMYIEGIMLEQNDFSRWYRRFKRGRYEG